MPSPLTREANARKETGSKTMKAVKAMMGAAVALLVTSSAAWASRPEDDWVSDAIETKLDRLAGDLQTAVGLDFLSREGFYVAAGLAVLVALIVFARLMSWARHSDELSKQRREVRARRQAEAEYDAAEAKRQKRRYGG